MWKIWRSLGSNWRRLDTSSKRVVIITGCDSGLGFRGALEANKAGLTVVATFLTGDQGQASLKMRDMCASPERLHRVPLDVTDDTSVHQAVTYVRKLLDTNEDHFVHAVVNNAGVMVFGEFEWQTRNIMEQQLSVNVFGTWRVSKAFLPLLHRSVEEFSERPRLVVVGSHCGIQPLPCLSVYASTKAAIRSWCEALRMELKPRNVDVVDFIPGSLVLMTNILARQIHHTMDMRDNFDEKSYLRHGENFEILMKYLSSIFRETSIDALNDQQVINDFMAAILDKNPRAEYKCQPLRYAAYHFLFAISPMNLRHWLVKKFMVLPEFKYKTNQSNSNN